MENKLFFGKNSCNPAIDEFHDMASERKKLENQMAILMDLLKIPEEGERNFEELKNKIENLIKENDSTSSPTKPTT